jgi:pyroglutamyl-peptidase
MAAILVTGFGRFPGAPFNPTTGLVGRLKRSRRPALADVRVVTHVFATRYAAVDRELPALIARENPDAILLFGVATRAKSVRIERIARNRISLLFPDAGGAKPCLATIPSRRPA